MLSERVAFVLIERGGRQQVALPVVLLTALDVHPVIALPSEVNFIVPPPGRGDTVAV
jgi:hypothetical protein